jgi:hypothetical protein
MEIWIERIEHILNRAPTRALSLSRLLTALKEAGITVGDRREWVLKRLIEQPDRFKVIPDRLGPWVLWPGEKEPGLPEFRPRTSGCDPWIMTCSPTSPSLGIQRRMVGWVQESLQAWGRELDDGSQVAVARWIQANEEAERAFGAVLSEEAGRA